MRCGLKCFTDGECDHKGQSTAVSERPAWSNGVESNMSSKTGSNVDAHSLLVPPYCSFGQNKSSTPAVPL